jgi:hypothetical protein
LTDRVRERYSKGTEWEQNEDLRLNAESIAKVIDNDIALPASLMFLSHIYILSNRIDRPGPGSWIVSSVFCDMVLTKPPVQYAPLMKNGERGEYFQRTFDL